jgi:hypothetical protein
MKKRTKPIIISRNLALQIAGLTVEGCILLASHRADEDTMRLWLRASGGTIEHSIGMTAFLAQSRKAIWERHKGYFILVRTMDEIFNKGQIEMFIPKRFKWKEAR